MNCSVNKTTWRLSLYDTPFSSSNSSSFSSSNAAHAKASHAASSGYDDEEEAEGGESADASADGEEDDDHGGKKKQHEGGGIVPLHRQPLREGDVVYFHDADGFMPLRLHDPQVIAKHTGSNGHTHFDAFFGFVFLSTDS